MTNNELLQSVQGLSNTQVAEVAKTNDIIFFSAAALAAQPTNTSGTVRSIKVNGRWVKV